MAIFTRRLAALLLVGSVAAQQTPVYRPQRYDEDWSLPRNPNLVNDPWDRWKYIHLGRPGWYLTLAGEARTRFEILDQPGFGRGPADANGYLLQRYLLSADWHLGTRFRVFTELQSGLANGRNGGPRPTDLNRLDIGQAFVDLKAGRAVGAGGWTLRAGRQEVGFGTGRLISPSESLNVRRSFDGLRLSYHRGDWTYNAVALKPAEARPGILDDVPDRNQTFWGAGAIGPHLLWRGANLSFYYLGLDKAVAQFDAGRGRQVRHTFGSRSWKTAGPWDFNYEVILQTGHFNGSAIRAWALSSDTGFTWTSLAWRPRLGLRADVTSGDRRRGDRVLNSFDPLFPSGVAYSGASGLLGAANVMDLSPSFRLTPLRSLTVSLDSACYWRQSLQDGLYSVAVTPLRPAAPGQSRFTGVAPSASAIWQLDRHATVNGLFSHFFTGQVFDSTPPRRNINLFLLAFTYRF